MNAQLRQDAAGILTFDPLEGRASAATVTIKTSGNADLTTPISGASATVDAVNTTTDGACGPSEDNRRLVPLATTSDIVVGRAYLLTGADGESEWVTVASIQDGVSVTARADLQDDHPSGSTFVGTRLTYTVDAGNLTETDRGRDYRVAWTYTVGGAECFHETFFDVVRVPWYRAATLGGLERANREVFARASDDGVDLEDVLDQAFDEVLRRIESRGKRPSLIIGMERLAPPTYDAALFILAKTGYRPAGYTDLETWIDFSHRQLGDGMTRALAGVDWYDENDDGSKGASETSPQLQSVKVGW